MKLLALFSLLLAVARMSHGADAPRNELFPNAPPVPAGAKVTIAFDRAQYFLGENVYARFIIENTGAEPFQISLGSDYSGSIRADRFRVTATDEAGRAVADPFPNAGSMGGLGFDSTIKPGETHTEKVPILLYRRFDRPGRYTVRISHDLGWNQSGRPYPVGEGTIIFQEPDAAQAERIVAAMEKLRTQGGEAPDFSVLRLPVFLAPLQRRAEAGDTKALEGLGSVESKEATEVLIRLAKGRKKAFALQAALILNARLPDPAFDKKLPPRGMFVDAGMESRNRLATVAWDERFSADVRALAVQFLADKEQRSVECGAFMIEAVGTPKEAPAVETAITRALGATQTVRDRRESDILNAPEPLPELFRAMQMLHQRGYEPGPTPKGKTQACVSFQWLAGRPGPRTAEWEKAFERFRDDESFVLREAALRSIPQPVPEKDVPAVMKGLTDRDLGVARAACEVAGKSGDPRFVEPLLKIIATASHEWLLNAATNALYDLNVRYELYTAWVARMAEDGMLDLSFRALEGVVADRTSGGSGSTNLPPGELLAIQRAWRSFLTKHEQELREGRKFKLGGPELTPELYGHAHSFWLADGKQWPPQPEPAPTDR